MKGLENGSVKWLWGDFHWQRVITEGSKSENCEKCDKICHPVVHERNR